MSIPKSVTDAEIVAELIHRKEVNPLAFFEDLPMQELFGNDPAKIKILFGGNRQIKYGTNVYNHEGKLIPIEALSVGDSILCRRGHGVEALYAIVTDIPFDGEVDTVTIETVSGDIICAGETHCFPVMYRGREEKLTARQIHDYINNIKFGRNSLRLMKPKAYIFSYDYESLDILPFSGLLLGLYLGDGSFGNSPSNVYSRPNFTNSTKEIHDLFKTEFMMSYNDHKCVAYPSDIARLYITNPNGENKFVKDLESFGLTGKAREKFIPNRFKLSSQSVRREILRGLFLTDGGTDKYKATLWSCSLRLLNDTKFIIESLGGYCKIYKDHEPENENQGIGYKLQLSNQMLLDLKIGDLFHKQPIGISRKTKRNDLTIKKVSLSGKQMCRCITVSDSSHQFVLENGYMTYNSGKTEKGAQYVITKALSKPNQRIWCCALTFKDSVDIQQRKIASLLPKNQIKYGRYDAINGYTHQKIILKNGTQIAFKSYEQGLKAFQSDDIDLIWNDEEPDHVGIYNEQVMRLMDRNGEMIFTMTSLCGMTELLCTLFEGYRTVKSQYAPLVDKVLPRVAENKGVKFFFLWTQENPHIDAAATAYRAKLMPKQEIMSRFYGIPSNLAGRIYPKFTEDVHVIPQDWLPEDRKWQMWNILDPHDGKPWVLTWWLVHITGTIFCVDEYPDRPFYDILGDNYSYKQYAQIIRSKEKAMYDMYGVTPKKRIIDRYYGRRTIRKTREDEGSSKTTVVKELANVKLKYKDCPDLEIEAGHMEVRKWLDWEENDHGEIVQQPLMFVLENCINTIGFMNKYSRGSPETPSGDVKHTARIIEKWKDFPDTVRYMCTSNPRYREYVAKRQPEGRIY